MLLNTADSSIHTPSENTLCIDDLIKINRHLVYKDIIVCLRMGKDLSINSSL